MVEVIGMLHVLIRGSFGHIFPFFCQGMGLNQRYLEELNSNMECGETINHQSEDSAIVSLFHHLICAVSHAKKSYSPTVLVQFIKILDRGWYQTLVLREHQPAG